MRLLKLVFHVLGFFCTNDHLNHVQTHPVEINGRRVDLSVCFYGHTFLALLSKQRGN